MLQNKVLGNISTYLRSNTTNVQPNRKVVVKESFYSKEVLSHLSCLHITNVRYIIMSSSRGNTARDRPQKHQNRTAFKNDLHDSSHKTKFLNSMSINGVCHKCRNIIEWKIKYKKYKMLTAPRKCVDCDGKAVKYAYHVLCNSCSNKRKVCAKCCKGFDESEEVALPSAKCTTADIAALLKPLPERKRRSVIRHLKKEYGDCESVDKQSVTDMVEEIIQKLEKTNFDDDEFGYSEEENSESGDSEQKNDT